MNDRISAPSAWLAGMVLALSASACAEDVPGSPPPADRLHFPFGLAYVPGETPDQDVLIVGNTNFDQRYNAGSLTSLAVDRLVAMLPPPGTTEPAFIPEFPEGTIRSRVRIYQFSSDLVAVKLDEPARYAVFTASRGRNRITMAQVVGGELSCRGTDKPEISALDCSEGFVMRTAGPDPFPVAYDPVSDVLVVGHLLPERKGESSPITTALTMMRPDRFMERIALEAAGRNLDASDANPIKLEDKELLGGTTGLAFFPGGEGRKSVLVTAGRRGPVADFPMGLIAYELDPDRFVETSTIPALTEIAAINLTAAGNAVDMRGVALVPTSTLAYTTVRFVGVGDVQTGIPTSSGIAVVRLVDRSRMELVSIYEIGEELGRPYLRPPAEGDAGRRLLYVADERGDVIYVLDASTERLAPVARIEGRYERTVGGEKILAHTLDSPGTMVFLDRGGRRLLFVTNFSNSTLSVIDVSDADPTKHRVIARFGRAQIPSANDEERGQ